MAPFKRLLGMACALFALFALGTTARSQRPESLGDPPAPSAEAKKAAWLHEAYLRDASEYEFSLDAARRQKLTLRREPVMRWSSEGDYHGDVYVWTYGGRPEVVGCIFSSPRGERNRSVAHEFHSLARQPLFAGARSNSRWEPHEAGITLKPVPSATAPAQNAARRLTEMREMARRFNAQVVRDERTWELRLLRQPIYRYEPTSENSSLLDGAVFAYVWTAGTDPELLLVLEAVRDDEGTRWHFALARFTNREVRVKYRDNEVWRVGAAEVGIFDGVTSKRYGAFGVKSIPMPDDVK